MHENAYCVWSSCLQGLPRNFFFIIVSIHVPFHVTKLLALCFSATALNRTSVFTSKYLLNILWVFAKINLNLIISRFNEVLLKEEIFYCNLFLEKNQEDLDGKSV